MKEMMVMFVMIGFICVAHAEGMAKGNQNQFLGRRAYAATPAEKPSKAEAPWEGTGMVTNQMPDENAVTDTEKPHPKQMRLHFLGKRPFGDTHLGE